MPYKGTKKLVDADRGRILTKRLQGKTMRAIAEEEGYDLTTVKRQLHDARTASLALDLKFRNRPEFERGFMQAFRRNVKIIESKKATNSEAIQASRTILAFVLAGEINVKPEPFDPQTNMGDFTYEELKASLHRDVAPFVIEMEKRGLTFDQVVKALPPRKQSGN
jgi:hypothetical protein